MSSLRSELRKYLGALSRKFGPQIDGFVVSLMNCSFMKKFIYEQFIYEQFIYASFFAFMNCSFMKKFIYETVCCINAQKMFINALFIYEQFIYERSNHAGLRAKCCINARFFSFYPIKREKKK